MAPAPTREGERIIEGVKDVERAARNTGFAISTANRVSDKREKLRDSRDMENVRDGFVSKYSNRGVPGERNDELNTNNRRSRSAELVEIINSEKNRTISVTYDQP